MTDTILMVAGTGLPDGMPVVFLLGAPLNTSYSTSISAGAAVATVPDTVLDSSTITGITANVEVQLPADTKTDAITLIPAKPSLVSNTITSASHTFSWTDSSGASGRRYDLSVNGVDQGPSILHPATSLAVTGLPTDGSTITVELFWWDNDDLATVQSVTETYTAATIAGLSTAGMQAVDLGSSDIALGSVTSTHIDGFMSSLTREYALNGGSDIGVGVVSGKRALRCELSIAGATDSKPTNRVSTGYDMPASRTYRVAQSVFIPPGFDGGGTKNNKPFGTGKLGFGLYSNVDVSGGSNDPAGFSMRFVYNIDPDTDDVIPGLYDYSVDRVGVWGQVHALPNALIRGQWNKLYMEVTSNSTISASDGRVRAWQGSSTTPVLDLTGKQMISSGPDTDITRCKIEVFMGGSGTNAVTYYTPANDQEISFSEVFIGAGTW